MKILPQGSPWRCGGLEPIVKQVKHSLKYLLTKMLPLMDFRCVFQEITAMINNRPLGTIKDSEILTPYMLLLGGNFSTLPPLITKGSPTANVPLGLQQYVKDIFTTWWTKWEVYILPNIFPYKKWKTTCPNIKARDVCLLHKKLH